MPHLNHTKKGFEMAKVSVLMNCFNGEKYVKEAIDSVYAQTYQDWEIVFIDNCSTDRSFEIANSYDNKIKIYKTPNNTSLCKARVFAEPFIHGDFLCILDIDDIWIPDKLEQQISTMESNPNVGLVYSNTMFFKDSGYEIPYYDKIMPSGNIFSKLLENYFFSFETVMIRRSVMKQYNLYFSPNYNVISDAEFFIKMAYNTEALYIDKILAKWRYGHTSESVQQLLSFPAELEILLDELKDLIPNFEKTYSKEITTLHGKIFNMYGVGHWKKENIKVARENFKKAKKINKKYLVPLIATYFLTYDKYHKLRLLKRKL